jgi:hypothetical protein
MNEKERKRKEAQERIDAARRKIQDERKGLLDKAPLITKQLLEGTNYKEKMVVKLKTGDFGVMEISSLGEGDLIEAFEILGLDRLEDTEEDVKFEVTDYDFFWTLIEKSTGFEKKLLKKSLAMGESSIVGQRILEISGAAGNDVETFLEK